MNRKKQRRWQIIDKTKILSFKFQANDQLSPKLKNIAGVSKKTAKVVGEDNRKIARSLENIARTSKLTAGEFNSSTEKIVASMHSLVDKSKEVSDKVDRNLKRAFNNNSVGEKITNLGKRLDSLKAKTNVFSSIAATYGISRLLSSVMRNADKSLNEKGRLRVLTGGDAQVTEGFYGEAYRIAERTRTGTGTVVDMMAKLGTQASGAFKTAGELTKFTEQIAKHMSLSGADTIAADAAMRQLTQAMASGVLRGDEFNSIMENASTLGTVLAESLGVSKGELRQMAASGKLTGEVLKNAVLNTAEKTDEQFAKLPVTISQAAQQSMNIVNDMLQPVYSGMGEAAQKFNNFMTENKELMKGVVVAGGGIVAAIGTMSTAMLAFNAICAANPLVLIAGALGGIIGGGYYLLNKGAKRTQAHNELYSKDNSYKKEYDALQMARKTSLASKDYKNLLQQEYGRQSAGGYAAIHSGPNGYYKSSSEKQKAEQSLRNADNLAKTYEANMRAKEIQVNKRLDDYIANPLGSYSKELQAKMDKAVGGATDNKLLQAVQNIGGDTGRMADSMVGTEESIEYLKDIAEQEAINRFTTASIHLDMGGVTNNVNHTSDVGNFVESLVDSLRNGMETLAYGGQY